MKRISYPLVGIVLLGALLRCYFLLDSEWMVEGDEAAVGLQALHILRGERPIFYPGQTYLGNFESYLTAAVFAAVGPSRYALKVVPFVFALLFIFLCYTIGQEIFGNERTGRIAALLAAIAPVYGVMWSLKARGGYIEALVLAQLAWLWAHRWVVSAASPEARRMKPAFLFGFIGGYVVWMNPVSVYVLAPIAIVAVAQFIRCLAKWGDVRTTALQVAGAAAGALIGLLPFMFFRIAYGDASSGAASSLPPQNAWGDLIEQTWRYLWQDGLPTLVGLRNPKDKPFLLDWRVVVVPIYALALIAVIRSAYRSAGRMVLLLMLALAFPIFVSGSLTSGNFAAIIPDSGLLTRYLLPLYLLFTLALAVFLTGLARPLKIGAITLLLGVNLWTAASADGAALARNEFANQPLPASYSNITTFLQAQGLSNVYTNHWIGYLLTLESREQIVTYDYTDTQYGMDRFPSYSQKVRASPRPALVVFNPHYEPNPIDARLRGLAIAYRKAELPHFIVYYDFAPRVEPTALDDVLQWPYY